MGVAADDLRGVLSEMGDLRLEGHFLLGVADFLEVNAVLVGEGVEDIEVLNGFLAPLLVPINQVDPMVQVLRDVLALQFFPEPGDEEEGVLVAPLGEEDIVHCYLLLGEPVAVVIFVDEHLGEGVYFGDELADVSGARSRIVP